MVKGKKSTERGVYYRAVKFEARPSSKQVELLVRISKNLGLVWNEALLPSLEAFEAWMKARAEEKGSEKGIRIPTLFDQINLLTARREADQEFSGVPRNWQEETLDRLNGSFKSFFQLRKNGDPDARTPRSRGEGFFQVIPGRSGFSIKNGQIHFAPNIFGDVLRFTIPQYCLSKIEEQKIKKFSISRSEHDLSKDGKFWISLVYEMEMPEPVVVHDLDATYVALGASSIGVVHKDSEHVFKLWRPDKHWKQKIGEVEERVKNSSCQKGSRKYNRLMKARRDMFRRMHRQQRQNHCEVVHAILEYSRVVVITEYEVRSKKKKLADGAVPERGGPTGLNWAAQNTGSFLDLVMQLEEKAKEVGGRVIRHRLTAIPRGIPHGHENKIQMARALREDYSRSLDKTKCEAVE